MEKYGEKSHLVLEKKRNNYLLSQASWMPQPPTSDVGKSPPPVTDGSSTTNSHCHNNSKTLEQRHHERKQAQRRLALALVICIIFLVGEVVGGYLARSLAVMTDAAHLLADVTSFLISLCSLWLSSRPATKKLNFGWYRAEILGALFSVIITWLVTGILVYLACERFINVDYEINGVVMVITSACAVVANIIMGLVLHQHSHGATQLQHSVEGNHNHRPNASIRAAFIHVVGDFLQSISVLISALVILFKPKYKIVDPICTFIFSLFVLGTTFKILRDILVVLMEGTPLGLNYNVVKEKILAVNGVKALHSLHLWALSMNQVVLTVHVDTVDTVDPQQVLKELTLLVYKTFNVHSATIQVEQHLDQEPDCWYCQEPKD
ncbi:proton-coupled zinc antiporter SLC30A8-like isoform X1 [Leucoraja erinacea]|uniref:proton-coupled zinc antiporter SLC30A8-like isoform X1 n=2 Tax=Leucoraja erinaceus TaxID=7782 RepID=UPI0024554719|nr:proton-coupled zinc antiporter SLC30A8-like isoform X1 [Leucoraja erinacea]XP_055490567.1 proton-coupled zinc antiporter SLC30A8-like isoform X1 [Leucoraja erinacea]